MSYAYHDEDDQMYRFKHPEDGSDLVIAKSGLSKDALDRIESMKPPKQMADGGEVDDEEDIAPETGNEPLQVEPYTDLSAVGPPPPENPQVLPNTGFPPQDASKSPAAAPGAVPGIAGMQNFNYGQIPGYNQLQSGINLGQNAATQQAQESQQALSDYSAAVAKQDQLQANVMARDQKDLHSSRKAILDGKLNPNQLWQDMSTGSKILTGISFALSGIGSGLTGRPNMAQEMFNNAINRDIEAQKANLGKQQTLYSMGLQKYHNDQAADAYARAHLSAALQAHIAKAAVDSGSLTAAAQAQKEIGTLQNQIGMQYLPIMQKGAIDRLQYGTQGNQGGGIPVSQEDIPTMMRFNPKYMENRVEVDGVAHQAPNAKVAEEQNTMESLYKPIKQDVGLLQSLGTPGAQLSAEDRNRANAALNRIAMSVNEFNGYKRFTDVDAKTIREEFNDPTAFKSLLTGQGATTDTLRALQNKIESSRQHNLPTYRNVNQKYPSLNSGK